MNRVTQRMTRERLCSQCNTELVLRYFSKIKVSRLLSWNINAEHEICAK